MTAKDPTLFVAVSLGLFLAYLGVAVGLSLGWALLRLDRRKGKGRAE